MDQHLISRIKEIADPIRAKGATRLYVFGSRGRDDFRPRSDLDVFVDYEPDSNFSIIELAGIKRLLEDALGLDVHITTRAGLSRALEGDIEKQAIRML